MRRPARLLALTLALSATSWFGCADVTSPGPTTGCDGQQYPNRLSSPYVLPYPVGSTYRINLGNCSVGFHGANTPDRYAYDFEMSIGTPITAIRAGEVVHIEESGHDGAHPNNLVVVKHIDDTYAQYMHLTHDGASVSLGQHVEQGDAIGLSGSTGLAGYPHLHLIVTRGQWPWPYPNPTPVSFRNASPSDVVLREGREYQAQSY